MHNLFHFVQEKTIINDSKHASCRKCVEATIAGTTTDKMIAPLLRKYSSQASALQLAYDHLPGKNSQLSPVVILHGLFGSKLNNRTIGRGINSNLGRDVYLVDLRNHGSSPQSPRHDYQSMRLDLEKFVDDHKLENPIVMGHSMGAKVAMQACLYNPKRYKMLISIENAPVNVMPNGKFVQYIDLLERQVGHQVTLKTVEERLSKLEKNELVLKFLMTMLRRDREGAIESKLPLGILREAIVKGKISEWDVKDRRYNGPSLFIRGTESAYIADEYIVPISTYFPNFELRDVKGGHWINVENSSACIEYISEFIGRKEDI